MSNASHTPMVVAAAKVLCKRGAEQCNVDFHDSWKVYGEDYLKDADEALKAAGVPELLGEVVALYAELADIGNEWPGRGTQAGQAKLVRLRDLIARATGRPSSDVQDQYSWRAGEAA